MKKYLIACLFIIFGCKSEPNIEILAIDVSPASIILKLGSSIASQQITAKVAPVNAADLILWLSDNNKVATVSQTGLVTATGVGVTNINVTAGNKSKIIPVSVLSGNVNNVVLYTEKNYKGIATELSKTGEYTDTGYKIASLAIPDGLRIKLYRDEKLGGGYLGLEENQNDLTQSGWYDNIVKITVEEYSEDEPLVKNYNYVLGTQIFNPLYGFRHEDWTYEGAEEMYKMGANVIKMRGTHFSSGHPAANHRKILEDFDFRYIYFHVDTEPSSYWPGIINNEERKAEIYNAMYGFVQNLLTKYNDTGKSFYLGHWEGDWLLLSFAGGSPDNLKQEVGDENIQGMVDWLNTRQKAIEDAKRDTPHTNVNVWGFTEANRTTDIEKGCERVVNTVLSKTNVDYLSYSAWDIDGLPGEEVKKYINYMDSIIPDKVGVPNYGKRVFIGETGLPAELCDWSHKKHNSANLDKFVKFFDAGVSQILYWEIYNNEPQRGFWLIDDQGVKWQLYYSFKAFYCNAKEYVRKYIADNGTTPGTAEFNAWASMFLKTLY